MFKKYSSIDNSYKTDTVDRIRELFSHREFCVQEKLHGANLSMMITNGSCSINKRSGPIEDGDKFYSYDSIDWCELYERAELYFDNHIIYGELIGGNYPHPDVEKTDDSLVQKGVFYSPRNEFFVYDVYSLKEGKFLNVVDNLHTLRQLGFNTVPNLFRGSLDECLEYSNEFQTTIPKKLGLPEIEDNVCEGVVIKPVEHAELGNGSRAILKNKNDKFAEKQKVGKKSKVVELTDEENRQLQECLELINRNRLDCVLSKIGQPSIKEFGKVAGLFTQDVLDDYGEVSKLVKREVNKNCSNLIRKNIDEIFTTR